MTFDRNGSFSFSTVNVSFWASGHCGAASSDRFGHSGTIDRTRSALQYGQVKASTAMLLAQCGQRRVWMVACAIRDFSSHGQKLTWSSACRWWVRFYIEYNHQSRQDIRRLDVPTGKF